MIVMLQFFLYFVLIDGNLGFLMMNSSYGSGGSAYQNLVGLIMDEKMSRHQLEDKLDRFEQAHNMRLTHIEQIYADVTKELQKDRNNRQQLIDENTKLNIMLRNVTIKQENTQSRLVQMHSENDILKKTLENLTAANFNLENDYANLTNSHKYLEQNVYNLTKEQERLSNKYHILLEQYLAVTSRNKTSYVDTHTLTSALNKRDQKFTAMLNNLSSLVYENKQKIKDSGVQLGFSIKEVNQTSVHQNLIFSKSAFNPADTFNMSGGVFICKRAGLYFFMATIVREPGIVESYASICVNRNALQTTVGHASNTTGYATGTAALVYHLSVGDKVYLCYDGGRDHMHWASSFNGFLIVPDF